MGKKINIALLLCLLLAGCAQADIAVFSGEAVIVTPSPESSPEPTPAPIPSPAVTPSPAPEPSPEPTPEPPLQFIFTGDVLLDSAPGRLIAKNGFTAAIDESLIQLLSEADWTGINLESPISGRGAPEPEKDFTFRAHPDTAGLLELMGVDFCALANNHTLDYGVDALFDTFDILQARSIGYAGAGKNLEEASKPARFTVGGKSAAVFSANRHMPYMSWYAKENRPGLFTTYEPAALLSTIEESDEDLVIVFVHWGVEYNDMPEGYQQKLAKLYIDAGADMVIGSHPHVPQGFEIYKGKLIAYSLGNFIFSGARTPTLALRVLVEQDGTWNASVVPCIIKSARTEPLTNEDDIQKFYKYLTSISFDVTVNSEGVLVHNKAVLPDEMKEGN